MRRRFETAAQGLTFAAIGVAATLVHLAVAMTASEVLGLVPLLANFAGYACAVSVSYLGHARLTFGTPARDGRQFLRFATVSLLGLATSQAIVYGLADVAGLPFGLALAPALIIVPAMTFVLSKVWAFRRRPDIA